MRLALALCVMSYHTAATVGKSILWEDQPYWIIPYTLVPMFFALSGFLISGSAMRLSLSQFLINRGLRIVPALAVEIFLSALIIGPLFTSFTWNQYFTDKQFFLYFTNIVGLIKYNLPGLFYANGQAGIVNAALWTIPYEIICYVLISIIIIFHIMKRPLFLVAGILIFTLAPLAFDIIGIREQAEQMPLLKWWIFGRGAFLFPSFLMGCLFYALRYRIPFNNFIVVTCISILVISSLTFSHDFSQKYNLVLLYCFCICYIMAYIGMSNIPKIPIASKGDYSYGIYLYHCPIINCVFYFIPWVQNTILLFIVSLPPVFLFAAFSWTFIEKPILKMRKKFSFVGKRLEH